MSEMATLRQLPEVDRDVHVPFYDTASGTLAELQLPHPSQIFPHDLRGDEGCE